MVYGTTEGFHEYGNSWFNNRDNEDAYNMFRSYNNEYYRGDDADDEFDDGGDVSGFQAESNDPAVKMIHTQITS